MRCSVVKSAVGLAVALALVQAAPAFAQSKCDAGKLKEYGRKVSCLSKVDSTAAKKGSAPDAAKETKCIQTFTDKCAKAEVQGDCTANVEDCADLATEADACRDATVVPSPSCADLGGVDVGGFCWFLGAPGASCGATCAAEGVIYDAATRDYAGSAGTDQQCVDVLDALAVPAGALQSGGCGVGAGCAYEPAGMVRIRCTSPVTDATASGLGGVRVCACTVP